MAYYTCLLLDADNTLLDFDAAEQAAITDTLNHYGLPHDAEAVETYHRVNRQLWDSLARGGDQPQQTVCRAVQPCASGAWPAGCRQRPGDERLL